MKQQPAIVTSGDIGRNVYNFEKNLATKEEINNFFDSGELEKFVNECINVFPDAIADYD